MMKRILWVVMLATAPWLVIQAQVDPNFYIYLCLGQSNMEGNAPFKAVDQEVDSRFQMLAAQDFSHPQRTLGQWYTATPPIVRQRAGLGMADYFGRTMVAALPSHVKVGVVDVAVGGIAIEGFMPDKVAGYLSTAESWLLSLTAAYDNNPYRRLVDMGRKAQERGVIKGILLHQGETNNGQQDWPQKVKQVYEALLADLGLNAADVPLLAGETVNGDVGGTCSLHNSIIARLPEVIPTAHVIPSNGCPCADDHLHFTAAGYRTMGKRYACEALRLLGRPTQVNKTYTLPTNLRDFYTLVRLEPIADITLRVGGSQRIELWGEFADGHRENLTREATFSSGDFMVQDGTVITDTEKSGTITASYTDFLGRKHTQTVQVRAQTPQEPQLEYVMQLQVTLGAMYDVGDTPQGHRQVIPITGGTFEGPLLRGTILDGGADYQLTSPDGHRTSLEAIYSIRTDDGVHIHVRNRGIIASGTDEQGSPTFYFKAAPQFEAPSDSRYAWLNDALFLCSPAPSPEGCILLDVWKAR